VGKREGANKKMPRVNEGTSTRGQCELSSDLLALNEENGQQEIKAKIAPDRFVEANSSDVSVDIGPKFIIFI
jgi:hypothetical protein